MLMLQVNCFPQCSCCWYRVHQYLYANSRMSHTRNNSFQLMCQTMAGVGSRLLKFNSDAKHAPPASPICDQSTDYKSTYLTWLIHIAGLSYLIAEWLKELRSFFVPVYCWKYDCSDQKIKIPKVNIFFGQK